MTLWCEATARGCLAQDTRRSPSTCLSHSVVRFQLHRSAKNTSAFLHTAPRMRSDNRFVYILRSVSDPHRHDVGATSDVTTRLGFHNDRRGKNLSRVVHRLRRGFLVPRG